MFSSKGYYKKISKIHEASLRLILNDYESSLDSLLNPRNKYLLKGCYKKINKTHEASLRIIFNDYES